MTNATVQPIATMTRGILIPNEDVPIEILAKYHADKIFHPGIKLKKVSDTAIYGQGICRISIAC